jgi:hypothetical protein
MAGTSLPLAGLVGGSGGLFGAGLKAFKGYRQKRSFQKMLDIHNRERAFIDARDKKEYDNAKAHHQTLLGSKSSLVPKFEGKDTGWAGWLEEFDDRNRAAHKGIPVIHSSPTSKA